MEKKKRNIKIKEVEMRKWIVSAFAIQSVAVWATVAVPSVGDVDIVQDERPAP